MRALDLSFPASASSRMPTDKEEMPANFDVLLRSGASGQVPHLQTIEQFEPPPEAIEKCRRWFAARGVKCHATQFGLACSASEDRFASLFQVKVSRLAKGPGGPAHEVHGTIRVPPEIADLVEQITVSGPPEFF